MCRPLTLALRAVEVFIRDKYERKRYYNEALAAAHVSTMYSPRLPLTLSSLQLQALCCVHCNMVISFLYLMSKIILKIRQALKLK